MGRSGIVHDIVLLDLEQCYSHGWIELVMCKKLVFNDKCLN